jgi:hypothetical protein
VWLASQKSPVNAVTGLPNPLGKSENLVSDPCESTVAKSFQYLGGAAGWGLRHNRIGDREQSDGDKRF